MPVHDDQFNIYILAILVQKVRHEVGHRLVRDVTAKHDVSAANINFNFKCQLRRTRIHIFFTTIYSLKSLFSLFTDQTNPHIYTSNIFHTLSHARFHKVVIRRIVRRIIRRMAPKNSGHTISKTENSGNTPYGRVVPRLHLCSFVTV